MDLKAFNIEAARKYHLAISDAKLMRDHRIRLAASTGASTREIARELNLTHGYVARIIRNSKQEEESCEA